MKTLQPMQPAELRGKCSRAICEGKIELLESEEESEFNSHLMYAYIKL